MLASRRSYSLFKVLENTMKKLVLLALAALFIPSIATAQCAPTADLWWHSSHIVPETAEVFAGATVGWYELVPCFEDLASTVCIFGTDDEGWVFGEDHETCWGPYYPGCYGYWYLDMTVPLDAPIGLINNVQIHLTHCESDACMTLCSQDTMFVVVEVVEPPPPIEIFQDTLTAVDKGTKAAYIPFQICNGDPAANPEDYLYRITSLGHVGPAITNSGVLVGVPGGTCEYAYGVIDASAAVECDYDTLTIVGYVNPSGPGDFYDTCVQVIHIIGNPCCINLFTPRILFVLSITLVIVAAFFIRKRTTIRA